MLNDSPIKDVEMFSYLSSNFNLVNKGIYNFLKGISPKVNIIEWLNFELASYNLTVQIIMPSNFKILDFFYFN